MRSNRSSRVEKSLKGGSDRCRSAADRHAARCASRGLCSGVRPSTLYALVGVVTVGRRPHVFMVYMAAVGVVKVHVPALAVVVIDMAAIGVVVIHMPASIIGVMRKNRGGHDESCRED